MVKLIKSTLSFLSREESNIFQASSIIMIMVFLSRILGLFRDRLLAERFAPSDLGIYYAAFRLPNMIFELLVMGALATAFIPVFTTILAKQGKPEAFKMASSVINIGLILFAISSLPIIFFTREISIILAPGFKENEIELMSSFTRIMTIAQVFPLILGNFFTGILQSFKNFIIPALAPIVYNLGIILGIVLLTPIFGLYAPVYGVVIGAILFTLIQIPLVVSFGYRHTFGINIRNEGVKEVGKLMLPRTIGLAVSQIDTTVDLVLSTLLGAASVTIFSFAQHLQQMPVGLFGASIAQAALPHLSVFYAEEGKQEFKKIFLSSFHQIFFLVIPVSAILIVLRIPVVRLVFGASTLFDWESTVITGKTLAFFSISLFAQSLVQLLARGFYALHDTRTPVIMGIFSVLINTFLSVFFIIYLHQGVYALGLSTSIASIIQMILLLYYLDQKVGYFDRYTLIIPTVKMLLSGLVTGVALYIPIKLLDQLVFDTARTINLIILTGIATFAGMSVYLFLSWFLEVPQMNVVIRMIERAKKLKKGVMIDATGEVINTQESKI